jgi:hypothetical protein
VHNLGADDLSARLFMAAKRKCHERVAMSLNDPERNYPACPLD